MGPALPCVTPKKHEPQTSKVGPSFTCLEREKRVPKAGETPYHKTSLQKVKLVSKKTDNGAVYTFARSDPNREECGQPGRPHLQLQTSQASTTQEGPIASEAQIQHPKVTEVSSLTWVGSLDDRKEASSPTIAEDVQRLGRQLSRKAKTTGNGYSTPVLQTNRTGSGFRINL